MERQLIFLLDTNIWLERLLGQEQAEVVAQLLDTLKTSEMCLTDLALLNQGMNANFAHIQKLV